MATAALILAVQGQHYGHQIPEFHLPLPIEHCTKAGGCTTQQRQVVMDSNWRWTHDVGGYYNCFTGNNWNATYCPNAKECTEKCAIDGVDKARWNNTYGVRTDGDKLNLSYVTRHENGTNVGSRTYLMDTEDTYQIFKLKNKEFTFDVDTSNLPCGLNGALYFVEMDADGGKAKFPTNEAGAKLGTGYCDAQCPHDLKWISGEANTIGWNSSAKTPTKGMGKYGTCCAELDLWEANAISTQMTVHGCSTKGPYRCDGIECGDNDKHQRFNGTCDKDGCDFNPYRVGATSYYGPGPQFTLDSTKPLTVVTQFITDDGTDDGDLVEMRRIYVQDGKRIANPKVSYGNFDSITDKMCTTQKADFGDYDDFTPKGGVKAMGEAMGRGMVLVLSLWDDDDVHMIWLDATDPVPKPGEPPKRGAPRGTCSVTSGDPAATQKAHPHANVVYGKIRYGELNSTLGPPAPPGPGPGPKPPVPPSGCPGGTLTQCMALCPASPPAAYKACVTDCAKRCQTATTTTSSPAAAAAAAASGDAASTTTTTSAAARAAALEAAPLEARLKLARAREVAAKAEEAEIEAEMEIVDKEGLVES